MVADAALGGGLPKMPVLDAAAVKAVRSSFPGKLLGRIAALLGVLVLVFAVANAADLGASRLGLVLSPPWLYKTLLLGGPAFVIAAQLLIEWRAERLRRLAQALALKSSSVPSGTFRIGPFLDNDVDRKSFARADGAHEKVFQWIVTAVDTPLYLTGDSGSGKSSLLNAFVLPTLREGGWTTQTVRVSSEPEKALTKAFAPQQNGQTENVSPLRDLIEAAALRASKCLLLVLDQFEEFVILAVPQQQQFVAKLLTDLADYPIKTLRILLVLRSDYQTSLDDIGLPRLRQGENFFQVGRFRESAALRFLRPLGLPTDSLRRLVSSASELDDTPGMVRPITLNVLGYVLSSGGPTARSLDAATLIRNYIAETIENPTIRAWARVVAGHLLTAQGTKRPRREAELCAETKFRHAEVRAVMNALAEAALARPLEPTQGVWELSHDFVARAISYHLGQTQRDIVRHTVFYAAPALLALTFLATSCQVQLVSSYDNLFDQQIVVAQRDVDTLMRRIEQAPTQPYSTFIDQYTKVHTDIDSLSVRANSSSRNEDSVDAIQKLAHAFAEFENEHRSGQSINRAFAEDMLQIMNNEFAMLTAMELAKKRTE